MFPTAQTGCTACPEAHLVELGVRPPREEAVELDEHPKVHILRHGRGAALGLDTAAGLEINPLRAITRPSFVTRALVAWRHFELSRYTVIAFGAT